MTLDLPPPILVQDARGMERLLDDLARQVELAVDTEANSFFNFREQVCLIQVTAQDRDYLVDPLAGVDLGGFGRVLEDPGKLKVFHDGEYDVLMIKRGFGFGFRNLFDTRVAAAALGDPNPGLASVLRTRFGVELDKSQQRSNWGARPLSAQQIRYARLDTRFLLPLMRAQRGELEQLRRIRIVEAECERLESLVPPDNAFDPDDFARIKGARNLSPDEQQAMRELFVLRNSLAEASDLPPFKVFNNQALIDLARHRPRSPRELASVPGLSQKQVRKLGPAVFDALARARELGPLRRFPNPRPKDGTAELDDGAFELHERLKQWRTDRAKREGYDASLVVNRHVLLRLAERAPRTRAELQRIEGLPDWQAEAFGDDIVDLIDRSLREFDAHGLPAGRRRAPRRGRPS